MKSTKWSSERLDLEATHEDDSKPSLQPSYCALRLWEVFCDEFAHVLESTVENTYTRSASLEDFPLLDGYDSARATVSPAYII
jgi:hypothetical protein